MLRLQRRRSPRRWAEQHTGLADTFARWRAEAEVPLLADELWATEEWRELRLAESYHLLCASPRTALPVVLRDVVDACDHGEVVARRWAHVLVEAGDDNEAPVVGGWGATCSPPSPCPPRTRPTPLGPATPPGPATPTKRAGKGTRAGRAARAPTEPTEADTAATAECSAHWRCS